MDDVERRKLIEALVSEVQIHEDRKKNGQWLKSITFKLPIIEGDLDISLDNETHVETMVILSKKNANAMNCVEIDVGAEDYCKHGNL
jgi:site-specific DNA recombinase